MTMLGNVLGLLTLGRYSTAGPAKVGPTIPPHASTHTLKASAVQATWKQICFDCHVLLAEWTADLWTPRKPLFIRCVNVSNSSPLQGPGTARNQSLTITSQRQDYTDNAVGFAVAPSPFSHLLLTAFLYLLAYLTAKQTLTFYHEFMFTYNILERILIYYFSLFGKQKLPSSVIPTSRSTVRHNVFWGSKYSLLEHDQVGPSSLLVHFLVLSWGLVCTSQRGFDFRKQSWYSTAWDTPFSRKNKCGQSKTMMAPGSRCQPPAHHA